MKKDKPYAQMTKLEAEYKFHVHLHNPTDTLYTKVSMETGAYVFFDDELVTTNKVNKEFGELPPQGFLLVDESDLGELDHKIWYKFQLFDQKGKLVEKFEFNI